MDATINNTMSKELKTHYTSTAKNGKTYTYAVDRSKTRQKVTWYVVLSDRSVYSEGFKSFKGAESYLNKEVLHSSESSP